MQVHVQQRPLILSNLSRTCSQKTRDLIFASDCLRSQQHSDSPGSLNCILVHSQHTSSADSSRNSSAPLWSYPLKRRPLGMSDLAEIRFAMHCLSPSFRSSWVSACAASRPTRWWQGSLYPAGQVPRPVCCGCACRRNEADGWHPATDHGSRAQRRLRCRCMEIYPVLVYL